MLIGLVSCAKRQLAHRAPARELYSPSRLFQGALNHVTGRADQVYILSSKYGLLPLDQVVMPYDVELRKKPARERGAWAKQVALAIRDLHGPSLTGITFEMHAGEPYRFPLTPLLTQMGATVTCPVEHLRVGERMAFYSGAPLPEKMRSETKAAAAWQAEPATHTPTLKIHAGVWLAAALLHEAGEESFSPTRLAAAVKERFGDERPGVTTHIHAHCVANAPKHTGVAYNYLRRMGSGELRLRRSGDPLHPTRIGGRAFPDQTDIPEAYWAIWRKWSGR